MYFFYSLQQPSSPDICDHVAWYIYSFLSHWVCYHSCGYFGPSAVHVCIGVPHFMGSYNHCLFFYVCCYDQLLEDHEKRKHKFVCHGLQFLAQLYYPQSLCGSYQCAVQPSKAWTTKKDREATQTFTFLLLTAKQGEVIYVLIYLKNYNINQFMELVTMLVYNWYRKGCHSNHQLIRSCLVIYWQHVGELSETGNTIS